MIPVTGERITFERPASIRTQQVEYSTEPNTSKRLILSAHEYSLMAPDQPLYACGYVCLSLGCGQVLDEPYELESHVKNEHSFRSRMRSDVY